VSSSRASPVTRPSKPMTSENSFSSYRKFFLLNQMEKFIILGLGVGVGKPFSDPSNREHLELGFHSLLFLSANQSCVVWTRAAAFFNARSAGLERFPLVPRIDHMVHGECLCVFCSFVPGPRLVYSFRLSESSPDSSSTSSSDSSSDAS
jgi:hypothetical protein